jgi:predicted hydrocarbon binding protein
VEVWDIASRMKLLSILTESLELFSGEWAKTICYIAGKKLSEEMVIDKTPNVEECLKKLSDASPWIVDVFEKKNDFEYLVVFRDCPIRQTHYTVCTKQGDALCQITHGYIESVISRSLGKNVKLILLHPGPNACLKRLVVS